MPLAFPGTPNTPWLFRSPRDEITGAQITLGASTAVSSTTLFVYAPIDETGAYPQAVIADSPAVYLRLNGLVDYSATYPRPQTIGDANDITPAGGQDSSGTNKWARISQTGETPWFPVAGRVPRSNAPAAKHYGDGGGIWVFDSLNSALTVGNVDDATHSYHPFVGSQVWTAEWWVYRYGGDGLQPGVADGGAFDHFWDPLLTTLSGGEVSVKMEWDEVSTFNPVDDLTLRIFATTATWNGIGVRDHEIHHVAIRVNPGSSASGEQAGDTAELFVDGASRGTRAMTGNYTLSPLGFGVGAGGVAPGLYGELGEFAFYESILTAARIETHYFLGNGNQVVPLAAASGVASTSLTNFTSGGAPADLPLQASSAVSSATLVLTATTQVPLGASSVISSATLALTAPTQVPLGAANAVSSATLALTAKTAVPLSAASAVASSTLALTAKTTVALGASSALSSSSLALNAPTKVTLGTASAVSSATLFVTAQTYIPFGASSAVSSATLNVTSPGQANVPLNPANAVSSATLALTAKTAVPLQTASPSVAATLLLTAATGIPFAAVTVTSTGVLNLTFGAPPTWTYGPYPGWSYGGTANWTYGGTALPRTFTYSGGL
jgi:hypothetical protein